MKKLTLFEQFIKWVKSLFVSKEKAKEDSDEIKREMCKRAIQGNVCPKSCDICAWNTLR